MQLSREARHIELELLGLEVGTLKALARERARRATDSWTRRTYAALGNQAMQAFLDTKDESGRIDYSRFDGTTLALTGAQAHRALSTVFWYVEQVQGLNDSPLVEPPNDECAIDLYLQARNFLDSEGVEIVNDEVATI